MADILVSGTLLRKVLDRACIWRKRHSFPYTADLCVASQVENVWVSHECQLAASGVLRVGSDLSLELASSQVGQLTAKGATKGVRRLTTAAPFA
eukprot:scaffold1016_cov258-Pinguiococcus_pyrenoidosus.AAC.21